jgi:hypothetical protein
LPRTSRRRTAARRDTFRTKRYEDYANCGIHLPAKYFGRSHILQGRKNAHDKYQQPVTDTNVNLQRMPARNYTMRIIEDKNKTAAGCGGSVPPAQAAEVVVHTTTSYLKGRLEQQGLLKRSGDGR